MCNALRRQKHRKTYSPREARLNEEVHKESSGFEPCKDDESRIVEG